MKPMEPVDPFDPLPDPFQESEPRQMDPMSRLPEQAEPPPLDEPGYENSPQPLGEPMDPPTLGQEPGELAYPGDPWLDAVEASSGSLPDLPQSPVNPLEDPGYGEALLDAFEASVEGEMAGQVHLPGGEDYKAVETESALDHLERDIEGTEIPPQGVNDETPAGAETEPAVPPPTGPSGSEPPVPPAYGERTWVSLQPPPAARPFFRRDGFGPPVYRPRGGRGVGVTRGSPQAVQRICPETNESVSQEECESCEQCRDWSEDGSEPQCYYEWQEGL